MELIFWVLGVGILVAFFFKGTKAKYSPYIIAALLFTIFLSLATKLPVSMLSPPTTLWSWSNTFGAEFSFRLDGLAVVMAVLISFIGTGVFLYSASYMSSMEKPRRFYLTLTIFTAAMLGLVLSDNMIVFFLFWETTSVCSFLLVGTNNCSTVARESARKALFITVGGGLMLLVGFILISLHGQDMGLSLSDSLRFSMMDQSIVNSPFFLSILLCMALGIATKSAQFPFHIWLPAAMAGPTPVSSFLHSATMVKAGVFLLARLTPSLGSHELWQLTFAGMGAITMVVGAILSASHRDIKKILAFSTIAVLGILVMLIGIGTEVSIKAAVVFLVAHALYKAALFQIVGNIDFVTGNRDIKQLGSLASFMPLTAIAAMLSTLSMAGAPPLFGFFGKELAYLAKLQLDTLGLPLIILAFLTNVLLVGLAVSICYRPFWSKNKVKGSLKKVPILMSIPPLVFAFTGLFIGIFPRFFDQLLGTQMASALAGKFVPMKLKLWHGLNLESLLVVGLSGLTLIMGLIVAVKLKPIIAFLSQQFEKAQGFGPNAAFDKMLDATTRSSRLLIDKLQNGDLTSYVRWTLTSIVLAMAFPIFKLSAFGGLDWKLTWIELLVGALISIPALGAIANQNFYTKVVLLGISGLAIVGGFAVFGAPDLALTQLLVEALVLIFVLLLYRSLGKDSQTRTLHWKNYLVALCMGSIFFLMMMSSIALLPEDSKSFFLSRSFTEAFGKNVVNVVLVDFRALDTFGEVVVVSIAALGSGVLLSRRRKVETNG